jgi:hypothetical protein
MVSRATPDGKLALSISLESLERVHQANLFIMSDWFSSRLGPTTLDLLYISPNETINDTSNTSQDIMGRVERAGITYINDTSDPPTPCPHGLYFSKNGSYVRLPPHAYAGMDCYDLVCVDGYTIIELLNGDPQCIPTPVTLDIIWICMSVIFSLISVVGIGIFCIHVIMHKTTGGESLMFDKEPITPADNVTNQPPPFSEEDEDDGQFKNIVTSIHLDDLSTMMLEGEFSPRSFYKEESTTTTTTTTDS